MLASVVCLSVSCTHPPSVRSSSDRDIQALRRWWTNYKASFLEPSGRVVRPRDGNDTVSEGQAYALLFSVLLGERHTFKRVLNWTQANLSRTAGHGDSLLAWRWQGGAVVDWNSASDADLDYALALILARRRWGEAAFLEQARRAGRDILSKETLDIARLGTLVLPGAWVKMEDGRLLINPSYFSPAAFGLLHEVTGEAKWRELISVSYEVWKRSGRRLGKIRGVGLPPDWCAVTEEGRLTEMPGRSTSYGWEALRVPMRAGMDVLLRRSQRARSYLRARPVRFFRKWFSTGHSKVAAVYSRAGSATDSSESLAMTATALFACLASGKRAPAELVRTFEQQVASEKFRDDYYGQSLAFFPLACRAGLFQEPWLRGR